MNSASPQSFQEAAINKGMKSPRFSMSNNRDADYVRIVDEVYVIKDETVHSEDTRNEACDDLVIDLSSYMRSPRNNSQLRPDSISLKSNSTDDSLYTLFNNIDIYNTDFSVEDSSSNDEDNELMSNKNEALTKMTYDREQIESDLKKIDIIPVIHGICTLVDDSKMAEQTDDFPTKGFDASQRICNDHVTVKEKPLKLKLLPMTMRKKRGDLSCNVSTIRHSGCKEEGALHPYTTMDLIGNVPITFTTNIFKSQSLNPTDDDVCYEDPFIKTSDIESCTHQPRLGSIPVLLTQERETVQDNIDNDENLDKSSSVADVFLAIRGNNAVHSELTIDLPDESSAQSHKLQEAAQTVIDAASAVLEDHLSTCRNEATGLDYCEFFAFNDTSMAGEVTGENALDIEEQINRSRIKIAHTIEKLKAKHLVQKETSTGVSSDRNLYRERSRCPADEVKTYEKACKKQISDNHKMLMFNSSDSHFQESRDDEIEYFDERKDDNKMNVQYRVQITMNDLSPEMVESRIGPPVDLHNEGFDVPPKHEFFTLEELKSMKYNNANFFKREYLLSDEDFCTYFGMSKMDWKNTPEWKRISAKRQLGIF